MTFKCAEGEITVLVDTIKPGSPSNGVRVYTSSQRFYRGLPAAVIAMVNKATHNRIAQVFLCDEFFNPMYQCTVHEGQLAEHPDRPYYRYAPTNIEMVEVSSTPAKEPTPEPTANQGSDVPELGIHDSIPDEAYGDIEEMAERDAAQRREYGEEVDHYDNDGFPRDALGNRVNTVSSNYRESDRTQNPGPPPRPAYLSNERKSRVGGSVPSGLEI